MLSPRTGAIDRLGPDHVGGQQPRALRLQRLRRERNLRLERAITVGVLIQREEVRLREIDHHAAAPRRRDLHAGGRAAHERAVAIRERHRHRRRAGRAAGQRQRVRRSRERRDEAEHRRVRRRAERHERGAGDGGGRRARSGAAGDTDSAGRVRQRDIGGRRVDADRDEVGAGCLHRGDCSLEAERAACRRHGWYERRAERTRERVARVGLAQYLIPSRIEPGRGQHARAAGAGGTARQPEIEVRREITQRGLDRLAERDAQARLGERERLLYDDVLAGARDARRQRACGRVGRAVGLAEHAHRRRHHTVRQRIGDGRQDERVRRERHAALTDAHLEAEASAAA